MRRTLILWAALVVAVAVACGSGGPPGIAPSTSQISADPLVGRATAALMDIDEIPVGEGEQAQHPGTYTAAGAGQVGAPWSQFMICSTVEMPDEGPPLTVEPRALAGAWAFGSVVAADERIALQLDQYAVVYAGEAAATAAVNRSRHLDCDAAIRTWAPSGMTWTVGTGPVPESVTGFRVEAAFRYSRTSMDRSVSAVMQSRDVVVYLRFSDGPDPEHVDRLLDAAAASLVAATG